MASIRAAEICTNGAGTGHGAGKQALGVCGTRPRLRHHPLRLDTTEPNTARSRAPRPFVLRSGRGTGGVKRFDVIGGRCRQAVLPNYSAVQGRACATIPRG
jgi:hypothetical protein